MDNLILIRKYVRLDLYRRIYPKYEDQYVL